MTANPARTKRDRPLAEALGREWRIALRLFLSPLNVLLLAAAIGLAITATREKDQPIAIALTILLGLVTSVIGGYWTAKYMEIAQQGPLRQRGAGAVRGLKLLFLNLRTLEDRIRVHRQNHVQASKANEPLALALDEILSSATTMQEQTISAIEDWTDVVPEAGVGTQLGLITDMRKQRDLLEDRLRAQEAQLERAKTEKAETKVALEKEIRTTREELEQIRKTLREKEAATSPYFRFNVPDWPGSLSQTIKVAAAPPTTGCPACGYMPPIATNAALRRICEKCGAAWLH